MQKITSPQDVIDLQRKKIRRDVSIGASVSGLAVLSSTYFFGYNLEADVPSDSLKWESTLTEDQKLLFNGKTITSGKDLLPYAAIRDFSRFFTKQSYFYRSIEEYPDAANSKEVIARHNELIDELILILNKYFPQSNNLSRNNESTLESFIATTLAKKFRQKGYWLRPVKYDRVLSNNKNELLGTSFNIIKINQVRTTSFAWRDEAVSLREAHVESRYDIAQPMQPFQTLDNIGGQSFNGGLIINQKRSSMSLSDPASLSYNKSFKVILEAFNEQFPFTEEVESVSRFHELGHELLNRRGYPSAESFDTRVSPELFAYYISMFYSGQNALNWYEMVYVSDNLVNVTPHNNAQHLLRNFISEEAKLLVNNKNLDELSTVSECFKNPRLRKLLEDNVYERIVERFPEIDKKSDFVKQDFLGPIRKGFVLLGLSAIYVIGSKSAAKSYFNSAFSRFSDPLKKELEEAIKEIGEAEIKVQPDCGCPLMLKAITAFQTNSYFLDSSLLSTILSLPTDINDPHSELRDSLLKFAYLNDFKKLKNPSFANLPTQSAFSNP